MNRSIKEILNDYIWWDGQLSLGVRLLLAAGAVATGLYLANKDWDSSPEEISRLYVPSPIEQIVEVEQPEYFSLKNCI
jgi:hypothetical protein